MPRIEELIANHKKIENKEVHYRLQNDLMEHVWSRFGHTRGNLMTVLCLSHDAWFVHDVCHTFDSVLFQLLLHMPRKLKGSPQVDEDGRREEYRPSRKMCILYACVHLTLGHIPSSMYIKIMYPSVSICLALNKGCCSISFDVLNIHSSLYTNLEQKSIHHLNITNKFSTTDLY